MNLNNIQWMNVVFFVKAFCCLYTISLSVRQLPSSSSVTMMAMTAGSRTLIEIGNSNSNNNNSNNNNDVSNQKEFEIDVNYLDDDYENGLLILRRSRVDVVNTAIDLDIDIEDEDEDDEEEEKCWSCHVDSVSTMAHTKSPRNKSVLHKISMALKRNPFMTSSTSCILIGNIASMIGIIPISVSGFLPALSIMATVGILHKK